MSKQYLLMIEGPCYSFPIGLYKTPKEALVAASEFGLRDGDDPVCWPDDLFARQDIPGRAAIQTLGLDENYLPEGYSVFEFDQGVPRRRNVVYPFFSRTPVTGDSDEEAIDYSIDPDQPFGF